MHRMVVLTSLTIHCLLSDPRVDSWPFMQSPIPVITILAAYLYFVLKLGPQIMEKRQAFDLKGMLVAYNAYQVVFSIFLCVQALQVNLVPVVFTCQAGPDQVFQKAVSRQQLILVVKLIRKTYVHITLEILQH